MTLRPEQRRAVPSCSSLPDLLAGRQSRDEKDGRTKPDDLGSIEDVERLTRRPCKSCPLQLNVIVPQLQGTAAIMRPQASHLDLITRVGLSSAISSCSSSGNSVLWDRFAPSTKHFTALLHDAAAARVVDTLFARSLGHEGTRAFPQRGRSSIENPAPGCPGRGCTGGPSSGRG